METHRLVLAIRIALMMDRQVIRPRISQLNYDRFMHKDWEFYVQLAKEMRDTFPSVVNDARRDNDEIAKERAVRTRVTNECDRLLMAFAAMKRALPDQSRVFLLMVAGHTRGQVKRRENTMKSMVVDEHLAMCTEFILRVMDADGIHYIVDNTDKMPVQNGKRGTRARHPVP
jgi:hypothetical protein